jgi:hypothetical protein
MTESQRTTRIKNLTQAQLAVVMRPGQHWQLSSPALDAPSQEWSGKRPPRRITLTDVQLGSYAVMAKEWPKPIDPEFFVRGFYKLVADNEDEPEQIAYRRLPALSIQQPWAWAIMRGYKPVENRTWAPPAKIIGRMIWVHAPKKVDSAGIKELKRLGCPGVPKHRDYVTSAILGAVRVVKVIDHLNSPWFSGPKGWILESPTGLPSPVEMPGKLKLWMPEFYRG